VAIKVESEVPTPVTSKLPLTIGIVYDEAFRNHVYVESSEDRPDWRIESGSSQVALFDQIFSSMIGNFQHMNSLSDTAGNSALDFVLVPKVEEMQFSTPAEMRTDFYEAWIKYGMSIHEPDGSLVTTWTFVGYGKSSTEFLKNTSKGLNEAMNVALRDAGAKLTVKFQEIPEIQQRLQQE